QLRGNGDPGIWESVRSIKKNMKIMMWTIIFIFILMLGGNYRGVSIESIRERLGLGGKQEVKQVDTYSPEEEARVSIQVKSFKEEVVVEKPKIEKPKTDKPK
ncbi:hypothetical protein LCGC14_2983190, partial [marine sediment metagenome]